MKNVDQVRNCYLVSLNDLNGGKDYVRQKIADYGNDLLSLGVFNRILIIDCNIDQILFSSNDLCTFLGIKGFRVDASKHMWPGDLEAIQVFSI